ncbi:hypothetical protein ACFX19_000745 [Malus domestica]
MEGDGIRCLNKLFRALIVMVILLQCVVNPSLSLGFNNISSGGVTRCFEREREALLPCFQTGPRGSLQSPLFVGKRRTQARLLQMDRRPLLQPNQPCYSILDGKVSCVSYSVYRLSRLFLSPIPTVALTRDREADVAPPKGRPRRVS